MKLDSEEAYETFVAYAFIQVTGHIRTGKLKDYLASQFASGVISYPCDLSNAKNMIISYKNYVYNPNHPVKKKQQSKKYSER